MKTNCEAPLVFKCYDAEPKKVPNLKKRPTTSSNGKVVRFEKKVVGTPGLNAEWKTLVIYTKRNTCTPYNHSKN